MTFGKRLSDDLEAVHSCDPALVDVDSTLMDHYLLTRDLSVLPKSAVDGASVLRLRPLLTKYEHLATLAHEPQAMRALFRHHVCGARGPASTWLQFESRDATRQLTEQSADEASLEFVSEFVALIITSASKRGVAAPFSPPDTWRQNRRLTARARALAALCTNTQIDVPMTVDVSNEPTQ